MKTKFKLNQWVKVSCHARPEFRYGIIVGINSLHDTGEIWGYTVYNKTPRQRGRSSYSLQTVFLESELEPLTSLEKALLYL